MSANQTESEGVYYRCLRGNNALVALSQDDSFTVEDDLGRIWSCHPIKTKVLDYIELLADPPEIDGELGDQEETVVRIVYCTDAGDVRTKLASAS